MQIPSTLAVDARENVGQESSEKSVYECVICLLIIKRFSSLNFADKVQLFTKGKAKVPIKQLTK